MRKYYLLNIIIAAVLFLVFYSGVTQNEFLFVHDQYIELSGNGSNAGLFTINPVNFGDINVVSLLTVFWDKVLYCLFFSFDISVPWIQRILVFIILNYILTLPLIGFAKIARTFNLPVSRFTLYVVSLFFTFNTYTFLWKRPCFGETHSLHNGYANSWKLTPEYIKERIPGKYYKTNADGSIDLKLILFNRTQSLFYNTALISFGYALILLFIIVIKFGASGFSAGFFIDSKQELMPY